MKMKLISLVACLIVSLSAAAQTYHEPYRPQVHFTPQAHWMNDPNGMVFYKGAYHLFYQYYPGASVWGPMHWGHAVSYDLIHWKHLPVALAPDSLGYIFSGSAVVDVNNTSKLGTADNPPLLAMFTYHNPEIEKAGKIDVESQGLAYSLDGGYTWTKYAHNPVIKNPGIRDFRDPKVVWHKESKQWIVALASGQEIRFYASQDCIHWNYLSSFGKDSGAHGGVWECPCLIPLKVKGTNEEKWALIVNINPGGPAGGSATQYFVGDFDGKTFTSAQHDAQWVDQGRDNYAGVTWSNAPQGRQIFFGWMNNWQYAGAKPTVVWSGATTLPRDLSLVNENGTYLLASTLTKELASVDGEKVGLKPTVIDGTYNISEQFGFAKAPAEVKLHFKPTATQGVYGVKLSNKQGQYFSISYDIATRTFTIDRTHATAEHFSDKFDGKTSFVNPSSESPDQWSLILDVSSAELFTCSGKVVATEVFYPTPPFDIIEAFASGSPVTLTGGQVIEFHSVW